MDDIAYPIKKITLLMGITLSEMGGSQKVVYDIIANLPEDKYDITLVTSPNGELIEWINQLNSKRNSIINIITLKSLRHEFSPLNDLKAFFQLYKIMRKGNYDIAHFHTAKIGLLGRLAAWLSRIPQIFYTVHGWGISTHLTPLLRQFLKFAEKVGTKLSTKIICVCKHDMDIGIQKRLVLPKKLQLIYNGISECNKSNNGQLRNELGAYDNTPIVGTIMRLKAPKVPLFTISVMHEVLKKIDGIKFVIIGDGILKEKCQKLIDSLGVENDIFLLGTRDDARELLNDIDVFLLFSVSEGLPIAIVEAMFASKPVVANKVGGIPELVKHNINGYLIETLDVKLASKYIIKLIKSRNLRGKMGNAGNEKAHKTLTLQKMLDKYEALYSMRTLQQKAIRKNFRS